MIKYFCSILLLAAASFLSSAEPLVWDFTKPQSSWNKKKALTAEPAADGLKLVITGKDSHIAGDKLNINADDYGIIRVTYSATGFPGKTSGEIFFAGPKDISYGDHDYFRLPSLICDGKEHTLELDINKHIFNGAAVWRKKAVIDRMRLDIVNEFPGTIVLKKLEVLPVPPKPTKWDFRQGRGDWKTFQGMDVAEQADGLLLNITGKDSRIINSNVDFDPKKFSTVRITYSASGFSGTTSGELFFTGEKNPVFSADCYFHLPSLICDGKEHSFIVDAAKSMPPRFERWLSQKRITQLRLDMVNSFPGKVVLKKIEMLPPAAPQFADLYETNIKQGWLWTAGDSDLKLTLPPGRHNVWFYGVYDSDKALQAVKNIPMLAQVGKLNKHGHWYKAGVIDSGTPIEMSIDLQPFAEKMLITAEETIPVVIGSGIPKQVKSEIATTPVQEKVVIYDPNEPYFQSRMISGADLWRFSGPMLIRRKFNVADKDLDKAVLQITADDQIDELYLNGQKITYKWSNNWRNVAVLDVTKQIKPGKNVLAFRFTNNSSIGGAMYDLTCRFKDKTDKVFYGDGSERIVRYQKQNNWFAPGFNDSKWTKCDSRPAAPHYPWTVYLPYTDFRYSQGSFEAQAKTINNPQDNSSLQVQITLKGTPALTNHEFVYAHLYPVGRRPDTKPLAVVSEKIGNLNPVRNLDGSVTVTLGGFKFAEYGGPRTGEIEFGVFRRNSQAKNTITFLKPGKPFKGEKLVVKNDRKAGRPTITVNGKPFYPIWLDVFYEKHNDGLRGADSPINVRTFLAGGNAMTWWIGPDQYDFSAIDSRISMLLREYPNAYVSAWIWCQPPHWYNKVYPERISKQSDGKNFPYYVSEVTFSDEAYRRDAQKALTAFVEHCEKYFGSKMFCYNLAGGISLEWQGWGCHSQDRRKVLNDYSNAAQRDFKAFAAKRYPDLKVSGVPSYEERTAPGRTIFRDPVKDAASIAYEEYYSESIVDCIIGIAEAVKKACNGNKLIGAYYGYYFEYGNMPPCTNGSGHNAMTKLLKSNVIDFLLSPPSYGVRAASDPGADMKVFASLQQAGVFSIIEDDTRTHLTKETGFFQTPNAYYTSNLLRRNFGMQLSRRNPLCLLPLIEGRDFSSPAIRADLHKIRNIGQKLFESDKPSGVQIAAVVDEHSLKYMRSITKWDRNTNYPIYTYRHNGSINKYIRPAQNILGELTSLQRIPLSQIGTGVDYIYLDDVPAVADKYKLWIFMGNFAASDKLQAALDAIKDKECTLLVAYGAGFAGTDRDINIRSMSEMLGMKFKEISPGSLKLALEDLSFDKGQDLRTLQIGGNDTVTPRFAVDDPDAHVLARYADNSGDAMAVKQLGKMKLVYYGGVRLTSDLLRTLAADAGIFIHSRSDDVYFCGFGVHTIYALNPGKKLLKFPQPVTVKDIFTDEVLAKNATSLELDMQCHETRILFAE